MKILSYSPSIHVCVACQGNGSISYYDISEDITSATISRQVDAASTFKIRMQNKGGKYNDVFKPWDMVAISLTKTSSNRVLTGYVTSADVFSIYPQEMSIAGSCTIYRLQNFWWDPQLVESQQLMQTSSHFNAAMDGGYGQVAYKLLTSVGGWDEGTVRISKSVPQSVMDWARSLYEAKMNDLDQLRSMVDEFYEVLQTSGPQLGGGGSVGAENFFGSDNQEIVWNYCKSQGFSSAAAAAVVGNAMAESGCDPSVHQVGGTARGMFQWEGGRFTRLTQIASEMGEDWTSIKPQLRLLVEELPDQFNTYTGKVGYYSTGAQWGWPQKVAFEEWRGWNEIPKATQCFCQVYERPGKPHLDRRVGFAQDAYNRFNK